MADLGLDVAFFSIHASRSSSGVLQGWVRSDVAASEPATVERIKRLLIGVEPPLSCVCYQC